MYLDHTNPDSVARNKRRVLSTLRGLRGTLQRNASTYSRCSPHTGEAMSLDTSVPEGADGLDVRLVANADGELWFATGDVQYDTVHGVACEAITINPNDEDSDLEIQAAYLVDGVANQLATLDAEDAP